MGDAFIKRLVRLAEKRTWGSKNLNARACEAVESLLNAGVQSYIDLRELISSPKADINTRVAACWVIGQLKYKRANGLLIEALNTDASMALAWEAAKSLGALGNKQSVAPLIEIMLDVTASDRRIAAAYALGLLADKRAVRHLVDVMGNQNEWHLLRAEAAESLGYIGNKKALPVLLGGLDDLSPEVRFWAAFALGHIGASEAIPKLEEIAVKDKSKLQGWGTVGAEASEAIKMIKQATRRMR